MGVPGFYRWAVRRVPRVRHKGCKPPYEFDCLYLDFNGVVHGCVEEWGGQQCEDVLFDLIEAELAMLIALAHPRLLLYVAIDGVAPRAKMNQQRSRRFRAAQEAAAQADTIDGVCKAFDRNAITPGTGFMVRLSKRLQAWAEANAQLPALRGVTVVISDDRDPGEGEHKIMEVIRQHPDHTHCLVSADADLVFLGLVSPAEHVYLLRANQHRDRASRNHTPAAPAQEPQEQTGGEQDGAEAALEVAGARDFELLSIVAVREFLCSEFPGCEGRRLAADFVAMCCLAGNDFLPHIPAVDIYQGGIDRLLSAYKALQPAERGFLVSEDGKLELLRWRGLLEQFAQAEVEAMFDSLWLGLGPPMQQYRGPSPPTAEWDGLSVLVLWAPPKVTAGDIVSAMSKQGCTASAAHGVPGRHGPKGPSSWLVRFADAQSSVKTLISARWVWGNKVSVSWVNPMTLDLLQPVNEPFEAVPWQAELDATVLDCFEFWLGEDNLKNDAYLRRQVRSRADGFVPIKVFTKFNRMQVLLQDCAEIVRILRTSSRLAVEGEGEAALVRSLADHSLREGETAEQVARQVEALSRAQAGDYLGAATALRRDYYGTKAGPSASGSPAPGDLEGVERHRSRAFLQGIEWVTRYYLRGCSSWSWFYPAHYPPLCVSLAALTDCPLESPPLHVPFQPELQLLAVLPPRSAQLLPEPLRRLLLDQASPLADFYPATFDVDLKEGDREWQAIILLPFVDEPRLREALREALEGSGGEDGCTKFELPKAFRAEAMEPRDANTSSDRLRDLGALLTHCCTMRDPEGGGAMSWNFRAQAELPAGQMRNGSSKAYTRPEEVNQAAADAGARPAGGRGGGGGKGKGKGKGKRKK